MELKSRLAVTRRRRIVPREPRPLLAELMSSVDMPAWLDAEGIAEGTPFLIGPDGVYDVALNGYGLSTEMAGRPRNTQMAIAATRPVL